MAENNICKRTSPRKQKPSEQIIPVIVESDEPSENLKREELPEDKNVMEDDNSSNSSICNSVKQMNISSDIDEIIEKSVEPVEEFQIPERLLPSCNVPEKIIIVYDCACHEADSGFKLAGDTYSSGDMIKRSLKFFLYNKHEIDEKHEFALVVLNEDSAVWLKDFTSDVASIYTTIQDIAPCTTSQPISLNKLFDLIAIKLKTVCSEDVSLPPSHVNRILFTYCRSMTVPTFEDFTFRKDILESPYLTFDVLMSHEEPCDNNNCAETFKFLQGIDTKGYAYYFQVGRSAFDLHVAAAKLLSHPLQRARQSLANYAVNIGDD